MIVRDEEQNLRELLPTIVGVFDEMVIVDTGSTDNTVQVAESFGATVHHFEWIKDFAAARNFSFEKTQYEWVMWLDADDRIEDVEELKRFIKEELPGVTKEVVMCDYLIDEFNPGEWKTQTKRERFIHRFHDQRWIYPIHESIPSKMEDRHYNKTVRILHPPNSTRHLERNLEIHEKMWEEGFRDENTIFHFGQDLFMTKQYERSIEILNFYNLDTAVGTPKYWVPVLIATAYKILGSMLKSLQYYLIAVSINPRRAEAWMEAGLIYEMLGDYASALPFYSAAEHLQVPEDDSLVLHVCYGDPVKEKIKLCREKVGQPA